MLHAGAWHPGVRNNERFSLLLGDGWPARRAVNCVRWVNGASERAHMGGSALKATYTAGWGLIMFMQGPGTGALAVQRPSHSASGASVARTRGLGIGCAGSLGQVSLHRWQKAKHCST